MATKTRKTTAKPKAVDTLVKWSKYYGKKSNVQFDPDTREPIVFSEDGTTVAKRFAWERKADMVTILGNPEGFKPTWSDIAVRRLGKLTTPILESRRQTEEQLREAEQRLLSLWSNYATPELRRAHQMEIIDAENAVRLLESNLYNCKKTDL